MNPYQMSDDTMAKVASMARSGRSLGEIAVEMHISLEMARSAATKWPIIERIRQNKAI